MKNLLQPWDSNVDIKADVSGIEAAEEEFEKQESIQKLSVVKSTTFLRGCLFILGFSLVFVALGASITAIGSAFHEYSRWIEIIGGIMIIIFGLNLLGILKIPGAQRDRGYKFYTETRRTCRFAVNRYGIWCGLDSLYWTHTC